MYTCVDHRFAPQVATSAFTHFLEYCHKFIGIKYEPRTGTQKKVKLIELDFYCYEEDSDVDCCSSKDINELLFGGEVNDELGEDD